MKAKTLIPLVIGLGIGFFAIKMGVDMVSRPRRAQETRKVLVASGTIPSATRITEQMLSVAEMPAALVPSGAFTESKSLLGRVTKLTIPSGVAVGQVMLAPPGSEPGLRSLIPDGYRAVSVNVNEASAVAGFLQPGTHVDVFAGDGGRRGASSKSRLILSDVEVGAVGQSLNEVGSDGQVKVSKSVTLFLKPEQVPSLHAASSREQVHLALRGDGEKGDSLWSKLFARKSAEADDEDDAPKAKQKKVEPAPVQVAVAPPQVKRHMVEVIQGTKLDRVYFDEQGRQLREVKEKEGEPEPIANKAPASPDPAAFASTVPIVSDPK